MVGTFPAVRFTGSHRWQLSVLGAVFKPGLVLCCFVLFRGSFSSSGQQGDPRSNTKTARTALNVLARGLCSFRVFAVSVLTNENEN